MRRSCRISAWSEASRSGDREAAEDRVSTRWILRGSGGGRVGSIGAIVVRPARAGDGDDLARGWIDVGGTTPRWIPTPSRFPPPKGSPSDWRRGSDGPG